MIIPPNKLIESKIIEVLDANIQAQQAGVDITAREIYKIKGPATIDFDNSSRKLPETIPLDWTDEGILLEPGVYKIIINEIIRVPKTAIGICFPRSTLTRSGGTLFTALWDPGYVGRSSVTLAVFNPEGIKLKKNARIGQIVFLEDSKEFEEYRGTYHKEQV